MIDRELIECEEGKCPVRDDKKKIEKDMKRGEGRDGEGRRKVASKRRCPAPCIGG